MPTKKIAQKIFVLDTNVILNNANSIFHYPNAEIIIPLCVINKLDDFKKLLNSVGRHARLFLEKIEEFQKQVDLSKGIALENKTSLRIYAPNKTYQKLPSYFNTSKTSTQVLTACLLLKEENQKPILVSNDVNLRIRAKIFGIESIAFDNKNIEIESLYEAIEKIELSDAQWKELEISDAVNICPQKAFENKYYLAQSSSQENSKKNCLLRFWGKWKKLQKVTDHLHIWNIKPRNFEQKAAIDLLLDPKIKIVFLAGKAGTGKTLLALASAIEQLVQLNLYSKILVARPFVPMGRDMGYLPGDIIEKITPWMQPLVDSLEFIASYNNQNKKFNYQKMIDKKLIELEALTYIRGRSIPNRFILIDEAQNLTPHEIKTIITRVGENSKIVLTGDPYQIDNPFVDTYSNGLSYVMEKMKNSALAGYVFLVKGERSELAELASNLL